MQIKCKRIIDGKTYNTETATQIAGHHDQSALPYSSGEFLFQTRFGAFFEFSYYEGFGEDDWENHAIDARRGTKLARKEGELAARTDRAAVWRNAGSRFLRSKVHFEIARKSAQQTCPFGKSERSVSQRLDSALS